MARGVDKRALFVSYYLGEARQNATRAAELAGYAQPWDRQGSRLLKHPKVQEELAAWRQQIRERGIAVVENRLASQNDRWNRLHEIVRERAEEMVDVVGGTTGLLVRTTKSIGQGTAAQVIEEYAVDTGLLKELRELEKHAAQELGQWTEKTDVTSGGKPLSLIPLAELSDEELASRIARAEGRAAPETLPE